MQELTTTMITRCHQVSPLMFNGDIGMCEIFASLLIWMEKKMKNKSDICIDIEVLKKLRNIEKHTQYTLGLVTELSTRQIKRIEKMGNTSLKTATLLCKEFDVELDQLTGKKPLGKSLPHYWCNISTIEINSSNGKDTYKKTGYVFDYSYELVSFITDHIDKYFPETFLPPCKSQVTGDLSQSQNKWSLTIQSSQEGRECLLFEFIPFRFTNSGMQWADYCPVDSKWLQQDLANGLGEHVTDYNTSILPKVSDPLYQADIYVELMPIEYAKFNMLFDSEEEEEHLIDEGNTIPNYERVENLQKYMLNNQAGTIAQFCFETEEQLKSFVSTVVQYYGPESVEANKGLIRLVPTGGFTPDCRLWSIQLSRQAKCRSRPLPWPVKHKSRLEQSFVKSIHDLNRESSSTPLTIEQLKAIAQECGHRK